MPASNNIRDYYTIPDLLAAHYDAMKALDRWEELLLRGSSLPPTELILETLSTWVHAMHSFSSRRSVSSIAEHVLVSKCTLAEKNILDAMTLLEQPGLNAIRIADFLSNLIEAMNELGEI